IIQGKYLIKPITLSNYNEIEKLYKLCDDYHIMCGGRKANKKDIEDIFTYTEKKTIEDSLTLGIFEKNVLIGLVDIFKNYPEDKIWMIGLLLLAPNKRNLGLGKLIHTEIKNYALSIGANSFQIGVLDENTKALKFWESIGYKKLKYTTIKLGDVDHKVIILRLSLK
ncbi:MAG: GNAT family N-acetyltransferase, partial [Paraclostridium sp.]|uniref:GNAT family N-acetyltransferase n=1 Tax=Paraclostridium sp. TaxID=2023273 RepID=UPI003F32EE35